MGVGEVTLYSPSASIIFMSAPSFQEFPKSMVHYSNIESQEKKNLEYEFGDVVQLAECLPRMNRDLSSILSTTEKQAW